MVKPGRHRHREPAAGRESAVACSSGDILAGDAAAAADGKQSYLDYKLRDAAVERFDPQVRSLVSLLRTGEAATGASPRASEISGIPNRFCQQLSRNFS